MDVSKNLQYYLRYNLNAMGENHRWKTKNGPNNSYTAQFRFSELLTEEQQDRATVLT